MTTVSGRAVSLLAIINIHSIKTIVPLLGLMTILSLAKAQEKPVVLKVKVQLEQVLVPENVSTTNPTYLKDTAQVGERLGISQIEERLNYFISICDKCEVDFDSLVPKVQVIIISDLVRVTDYKNTSKWEKYAVDILSESYRFLDQPSQ